MLVRGFDFQVRPHCGTCRALMHEAIQAGRTATMIDRRQSQLGEYHASSTECCSIATGSEIVVTTSCRITIALLLLLLLSTLPTRRHTCFILLIHHVAWRTKYVPNSTRYCQISSSSSPSSTRMTQLQSRDTHSGAPRGPWDLNPTQTLATLSSALHVNSVICHRDTTKILTSRRDGEFGSCSKVGAKTRLRSASCC